MSRLILVGDATATRQLLAKLPDGDYGVTLAGNPKQAADLLRSGDPPVLLTVLDGQTPIAPALLAHPRLLGWMAWNRYDRPDLAAAAYALNAAVVLPGSITSEGIRAGLRMLLAQSADPSPQVRPAHGGLKLRRGAHIALSEDDVLSIEAGIVATQVVHEDGTDVLVGLDGPGDLVTGHPRDACCLRLTAHTDVRAMLRPWTEAVAMPRFIEGLRDRMWRAESWAAIQARPRPADRLLGLLSTIAERFGHPEGDATLLDVRLTQTQLSTAIGATRGAVAHLLREFRRARILDYRGSGHTERLVLRIVERHRHSSTDRAGAATGSETPP